MSERRDFDMAQREPHKPCMCGHGFWDHDVKEYDEHTYEYARACSRCSCELFVDAPR